jgi:hypothetical protein
LIEEPNLPYARDLRAEAEEAGRRGVPLLVLYSLPACPYCNEVRRSHLAPMIANPSEGKRAIIRQIDIGGTQPARGFDGKPSTHGDIARAAKVSFAPVVALYGPGGRQLAEPLKGMLLPDFYSAYLDDAISAATAALTRETA